MFRKSAARTATVVALLLSFVAPIGASELPKPGHTINFYTSGSLEPESGKLVSVDDNKTNPMNKRFIWVVVKVFDEKTTDYITVNGWYEHKKEAKKPVRSCCSGAPRQNVVVIQQNNRAAVPPLRHYVGPVSFSVHNDNRDFSTHTTNIVNPTAPGPARYGYCECGTPIRRYGYGEGGVRVGHFCNRSGRYIRWH